MSLTAARAVSSIRALVMLSGPRTSPARTIRLVVVSVSQATRANGSCDKYRSTMLSEIRSQTLSGCPSETDSLVKRKFLAGTQTSPLSVVGTVGQGSLKKAPDGHAKPGALEQHPPKGEANQGIHGMDDQSDRAPVASGATSSVACALITASASLRTSRLSIL